MTRHPLLQNMFFPLSSAHLLTHAFRRMQMPGQQLSRYARGIPDAIFIESETQWVFVFSMEFESVLQSILFGFKYMILYLCSCDYPDVSVLCNLLV